MWLAELISSPKLLVLGFLARPKKATDGRQLNALIYNAASGWTFLFEIIRGSARSYPGLRRSMMKELLNRIPLLFNHATKLLISVLGYSLLWFSSISLET